MSKKMFRRKDDSRKGLRRKGGSLLVLILLAILSGSFGLGLGKGVGFGRDSGNQETATGQGEAGIIEERSLTEVLQQDDVHEEMLPDTVEIRITEDRVYVNGWFCKDQEELRQFLTTFQADNREFEIVDDRALQRTYEWVINVFESMSLRYSVSTTY